MAPRTVLTIKERLRDMTRGQKITAGIVVTVGVAFVITFFLLEKQIFQLLEPAVNYIRNSSAGIPVLAAIMFATCIFPLFGYGVVSMICGYVYGVPKGFLPAFIGDVLGASAGFWLYRLAFNKYFARKFGDNLEFREISKAVSKDGLFILFLIRLSSFPFAVLNAYFGALTQLPYWRFILATTLSTPRLFLPIFIGQSISSLSNPNITGKDRVLKWAGNILGIVILLVVGWYLYRHTTRRIQRINAGLVAEEGDEEDDIERIAREAAQQQQQEQQQQRQQQMQQQHQQQLQNSYKMETRSQAFQSGDRQKRENIYDTPADMEELQSLHRSHSDQRHSSDTIVLVEESQPDHKLRG
ncbi:snare associated Golgi protein-domain-containing protein [Gamsiella multidivaricata]|uniref:snare associated Golgi protein-domain-containing protein n=1 Tax=Gamsiella multidivaricata TaxID=101098 RepID=UPI00221EBAB9|nr:snare associated Golgi protein-domain-containing protein [Gamsiella multidivaricata]KAI7828095.1 snare associated Golgi protein-domain-containing protein [Gamsiella multidivaricata]